MKLPALLLLVFGLVQGNPVQTPRSLQDDLYEFAALVPKHKVIPIFVDYMRNDAEVQGVIDYIKTEDFHELVRAIEKMDYLRDLYKYLSESGLDVYWFVNGMHDFIGMEPFVPFKRMETRRTGGLAGLISDIMATLPKEKFRDLYFEKLETSEDFREFVKRLQAEEFQEGINALFANEEFQFILQKVSAAGVDVEAILSVLSVVFDVEFPYVPSVKRIGGREGLHDDLEDFLELLPWEKLVEVVTRYLEHDPEVQSVVDYIQSEEFRELVRVVEEIEDVIKFYDYLHESGLNVYDLVNQLHDIIGLPHLPKPSKAVRVTTNGVRGMIDEIKALLPFEEIKKMYFHKLETSEHFRQLIERLESPQFQAIIDQLMVNEEFQTIISAAKEFGIDVRAVAELLSNMFGVEFPTRAILMRSLERSLHDDLEDFKGLLPLEEITEVVLRYVEFDEEVQSVIEYVQSVEFRELVRIVEEIEDVIHFYDYLHESGLNVYKLVNMLHDFVGLPHLTPPSFRLKRVTTNGVAGLIAEIKALLPLEDIKAMYHHKLETSVHFKQLVERLQSPKFQAIIDTLIANREFQAILAAAKEFGVDVRAFADLLSTVFGLEFPNHFRAKRALHDDLDDFMELLPLEEITEVVLLYLEYDEEVKTVVDYVQSKEFIELIQMVEEIEDVIHFYDYLHESGLNVYDLVNKLHDFVGLPHLPKPSRALARVTTNGVKGLIAEIKALLPLEDIKAMYHLKLETSIHFQQLVEKLQSPKFQAIIDTLIVNEEFQAIIKAAKEFGIDVKAVADLLSTMFGLEFPGQHFRRYNINDHFSDFIVLLPFDKIAAITVEYILNDVEVLLAVGYLKSDQFKDLMIRVENDPEVREFYEYFKALGADFKGLISILNDFLGISPRGHANLIRKHPGGGVQGMLNEFRKVIPYEDIKALYEDKMKTSEEFKFFVDQLKTPEFQALVDKLLANSNIKELEFQAQEHGININHITEFLSELLGLKFPEYPGLKTKKTFRNLNDDLNDFFALVNFEEFVYTVVDYVMHDPEVQQTAIYLRSEEYKILDRALHQIPEYNEILQELSSTGFSVEKWINDIHSFLGLDPYHPVLKTGSKINKPGVAGLIDAIRALLPYEDIKSLYHQKLKTSVDFKFFVELIKSEKFQKLTDTLFANKEFQSLLHKAESHGVNLTTISDFFFRVFGITTPPGIIGLM